jgi:hypothetical protein
MDGGCGCCSLSGACGVTRRSFLTTGAIANLAGVQAAAAPAIRTVAVPVAPPFRTPLRVQPVFLYEPKQRKDAASWRWSAEIYTEQAAGEEQQRIRRDLAAMRSQADFPVEILPLAAVSNVQEAAAVAGGAYDALVMYAASRQRNVMEALARPDRWNLVFVRHKSGPIYYMYIGVHGHFLRKTRDEYGQPGMGIDDIVVDDHGELLWRLRALCGLKNALGRRIVSIGAAGGWGEGGREAPQRARSHWKFDIRTVPYSELEQRIQAARRNEAFMKKCRQQSAAFLKDKGLSIETSPEFVSKSFVLTELFREIMAEHGTGTITIGGCMQTVMPMSETTACLPLSILNDEGYLAFCESDFVAIPAGVLLHSISGKPVFLGNASFPYKGIVTVSHCTAPRKMDGRVAERARILTHYESDYGAAPKVEMRKGQGVTVLDADFAGRRWLGFGGEIINSPFFPICRTQLEIGIRGDTASLARELRGWHWIVSYGDYLRETAYALGKQGVGWYGLAGT